MADRSADEPSPRRRIEAESRRQGRSAFVGGCTRILGGDYSDERLIRIVAGHDADYVLGGHEGPYWFRVWAARGLFLAGEGDGGKAIARNLVGDALGAVALAQSDPVPRVRRAAERAVRTLSDTDA